MAAFGLFSAVSAAAIRVASLNLCTDEYLLLLAKPGEAVSVTKLVKDGDESPLAMAAANISANRGRLEDVLPTRPTLILTMGGGGRSSGAVARALHLRVLDLPQPNTPADVAANLQRVAAGLGDPSRARGWKQRLAALVSSRPSRHRDAIWLGNGGISLVPSSLGAQWLALAGLRQRSLPGGRATLETLVIDPPQVLVTSNYRAGQMSSGQKWLSHPLLARLPSQRLIADGRRWTCGGPLMLGEIERFRAQLR